MSNLVPVLEQHQTNLNLLLSDPSSNQDALRALMQTMHNDRFCIRFNLRRLVQQRVCNGYCGLLMPANELHTVSRCHHTVCYPCLLQHVLSSSRESSHNEPLCPQCMRIPQLENIPALTPQEVELILQKAAQAGLLPGPSGPSGPTDSCNSFTGCPFFNRAVPADQVVTCRCTRTLCRVCLGKYLASRINKEYNRLKRRPLRWTGNFMVHKCPNQTSVCEVRVADLRGLLASLPPKYAAATEYIDLCPSYFLQHTLVEFRECSQCQTFAECMQGRCYGCTRNHPN